MNSHLLILPFFATITCLLLTQCSQYGGVSYEKAPKVLNVSSYDPKEKQRSGETYTPLNQSSLKANGALGLIARSSKGAVLDQKCGSFLKGADLQNMLLGTYHYITPDIHGSIQAERYVNRTKFLHRTHQLKARKILLVGDVDTNCKPKQIVDFITRMKELTGVYPVIYLENSDTIRASLNAATKSQKKILRRCPYWLALYSSSYNRIETPKKLAQASGVWNSWAMWQYGGVFWENGRSQAKYYRGGPWQTPEYFGNIDRPMERNAFNGSTRELHQFWNKHSLQL